MNNRAPTIAYTLRCAATVALLIAALSGCASRGGRTYNDWDTRQAQTVRYGTVVDVTKVQVEDDPSLLGPVIGGVAGGVVGSIFGGGSGKVLTTLGGALGGALIGGATEAYARKYTATQLTIELEDGGNILIVQGDDEYFTRGDAVRVIYLEEGKARVQRRS